MILIFGLPLSLYIPIVQDWVCQAVVEWLNKSTEDIQFSVGKVRIGFPLTLKVSEVSATRVRDGQTLFSLERLETGLDKIPLDQPYFVVESLDVSGVMVAMDSITESLGILGGIDNLNIRNVIVDPDDQLVEFGAVDLERPELLLYLAPSPQDTTDSENASWTVRINNIRLADGSVELSMSDSSLVDALTSIYTLPYLNHQHLSLSDINIEGKDVMYNGDVKATVLSMNAHELNSDIYLQQLSTGFRMDSTTIWVDSLDLQLQKSHLGGSAVIDLTLLDSVPKGRADLDIKADLNHSELTSLAYGYVPELLHQWVNADVNLDAKVNLDVADEVSQRASLNAKVNYGDSLVMRVKGSLEQNDIVLDAHMDESRTEILTVKGKANLKTEAYDAVLNARNLNIGHFLPQVAVHRLDANAQLKGQHFTVPSKWTWIDASATLDRMTYTDQYGKRDSLVAVTAVSSLKRGKYLVELNSQHPSLQLGTYLEGLLLPDTVSAEGNIDLGNIDIARLPVGMGIDGMGTIGLEGRLNAAWDWKNWANLSLRIDTLTYHDEFANVKYGEVSVDYKSTPQLMYAYLKGGDALVKANVDMNIVAIPKTAEKVSKILERQLNDWSIDIHEIEKELPTFSVNVDMKQDNPLYGLAQFYGYSFDNIHFKANNHKTLSIDMSTANLSSDDGLDIDSAMFRLGPNSKSGGAYAFDASMLSVAPKAKDTYIINAKGEIWPDSIVVDGKYEDGNYLTHYDAAVSLHVGNDTVTIHLEKDPVIYGQKFKVNEGNFFSLMQYLRPEDRKLNSRARMMLDGENGTSLSIYTRKALTTEDITGNQLLIMLKNADLTQMAKDIGKPGVVSGKMSVTAAANLFPDSITALARVQTQKFTLGDYKADSITFNGRVELIGRPGKKGSRSDIDGTLKVEDIVKVNLHAALVDSINMRADIRELPLELTNIFIPQDVTLKGNVNGQVNVNGPDANNILMNGYLTLRKASVDISDLDAHLRFCEDSIRIMRNRLFVRGYNIYGANDKPISIRGIVDMSKSLTNPKLDLTMRGDNVRLIDSKRIRLRDQYVYGRLPISTDISLMGTAQKFSVRGSVNLLSGTNLTCYLPADPLQQQSKVDGLVEFVSFRQLDRRAADRNRRQQTSRAPIQDEVDEDIDIQVNIDIAKDARVRAYLSEADKNYAEITGGGQLKVTCDESARLQMGGFYDVSTGTLDYKLPVIPVAKKFTITNSSYLSWNGEVSNPQINIQATENVRATVNNENSGSRIVRFLVAIDISGTLSALDMKFSCTAPDDGTLNTELAAMTEEENSKAAIMLLLAQTYMGPGSSNSMGLSTANSAVSAILNRQIESAFGSAAPQVNLGYDNFDTEEGGQRTEYSIKLSQKFGDRFRATIGGKVSQGSAASSQSNGAQLDDVSFEWLIKKDGSHYLHLYRKTNYESILDGQIIETGVGYVQESEGYRFRDLIIPTSKKRKERIEALIKEMQEKERQEEREKLGFSVRQRSDSTSVNSR